MSKKKLLLVSAILSTVILAYFYIQQNHSEQQLAECIDEILVAAQINSIQVETNNRGKNPLLKGSAKQTDKDKIIQAINQHCDTLEIQDFIEVIIKKRRQQSMLSFQIDNVNNAITIDGLVSNQKEQDDILSSFATSINDKTINHTIKIDPKVTTSDYSIYTTLLLSSIDNIQLADITIENKELTLKGLVRDKIRILETVSQLQLLFEDDLKIINQLELVVEHAPEIEKLKFDLAPIPILEKPIKAKNNKNK